ncbi:MAG: hypothetical protein QM778_20835 [Myxococcales bacterium]
MASGSVKSLLVVALSAVAFVALADVALGRIARIPAAEYETAESIDDYHDANPDVLVLGSSYVRSFIPLAGMYKEAARPLDLSVVPIEGGRFLAYTWLLTHRLQPMIDEKNAQGALVRPKLKHMVVVTNYWDICGNDELYPNLPARAWDLGDYVADFAVNGSTPFNANYVDQRWNELTTGSALVRDRGVFRIFRDVRERFSPKSEADKQAVADATLVGWIDMIKEGDMTHPKCIVREQEPALDRMMEFAQARNVQVTFVIWPVIPKAQNAETLAVTDRFKAYLEKRAAPFGAKVLDFQTDGPLVDADFRPDLDHLIHEGDVKISRWALEGPLKFLGTPAPATLGSAGSMSSPGSAPSANTSSTGAAGSANISSAGSPGSASALP